MLKHNLLIMLLFAAASASAQVFERPTALPPAELELLDSASAAHLESAKRFLAEEQWDEAVESIRRVMEADGGKLVKVDLAVPIAGFERYVPAGEFCQWRLAALAREAPPALAHYRLLVDALATGWLKQGTSERNEELLQRVTSQAFASSSGDDALLRLGDLALERGEHAAARAAWQRISPQLTVPSAASARLKAAVGSPLWLALRRFDFANRGGELPALLAGEGLAPAGTYPDTDLKLADARARLVLASILEGSLERARVELEILRALDPDAEGTIAGRTGKYADELAAILSEAANWPPLKSATNWPTFAGSQTREKVSPSGIDPASRPLWSFALPKLHSDRELVGSGRLRVADDMKALLAYFPIVVGNTVLIRCDANLNSYVVALDLRSGKTLWQVDYPRGVPRRGIADAPALAEGPFQVSDVHADLVRHVGVARYTATAHRGKAFVRMGSAITSPAPRRMSQWLSKDQGFLLGLDLTTEGKPLEGFPIRPESNAWSFEGAPVTDGECLYIVMRRSDGARSQLYVAAFELQTTAVAVDNEDENARPTGRLRWRVRVSSAATLGGGDVDELSHLLLTLQNGQLYLNTNAGVVASLSTRDGKLAWLVKYPRSPFKSGDPDRGEQQFFRDLTPCLAWKDLVIVAPGDSDRLFALEAATGQVAWSLPPGAAVDAVHLLGIGQDTLLASGDWLYWIDAHTGRLLCQFPQAGPSGAGQAAPSPRGLGRGVLAGSHVYFPTRESIFVFDQRPVATDFGWQPKLVREIPLVPRSVTGGNLTIAGGVLLIATGDRLVAFGE